MNRDELVLGIDCSTTSCKAIAWDRDGRAHAEGRAAIALVNPAKDAWEQDADAWWSGLVSAVRSVTRSLGEHSHLRIRALCITHQRETFVLTDEQARPLHPALVWMDARCRAEVGTAVEHVGRERLHTLSGKPPCTTPSLYKLMFLLGRGAPELASLRPIALDVHAFLVWKMVGRRVTSLASADPMGMLDMQKRDWSDELIELAGLGRKELPELIAPGERVGTLCRGAAEELGLDERTLVVAGAGDGQSAGVGAGIVGPGRAYLNLGTAIVSGVLSNTYRTDNAFRTLYGVSPGTFFLETDLKGGTFTLSWLAERLLGAPVEESAVKLAELENEARTLGAGADGLVLVPYWNGVMNPYWDDDASGVMLGLHGGHGPAHLYRATLEGIALEQRLHTEGVEAATGAIEELVVMGGGSRSELWCQILADVMNKRIVRAGTSEATSLGAGVLAAVAAGFYPDLASAVAGMTRVGESFVPGVERDFYERLYQEVYKRVYPALSDVQRALSGLRRG